MGEIKLLKELIKARKQIRKLLRDKAELLGELIDVKRDYLRLYEIVEVYEKREAHNGQI